MDDPWDEIYERLNAVFQRAILDDPILGAALGSSELQRLVIKRLRGRSPTLTDRLYLLAQYVIALRQVDKGGQALTALADTCGYSDLRAVRRALFEAERFIRARLIDYRWTEYLLGVRFPDAPYTPKPQLFGGMTRAPEGWIVLFGYGRPIFCHNNPNACPCSQQTFCPAYGRPEFSWYVRLIYGIDDRRRIRACAWDV